MLRRSKLTASVLLVAMLGSFVAPTEAFKIDTHVWVAQQVLNDALDGTIEIAFAGGAPIRLKVEESRLRALKNHPEMFRLGSLGPDAFPDVLIGQMVIHPSVTGGWGTGDWLRHMDQGSLTDEHRAFALGYLTHAAADVFAHTYVNRYTGAPFSIEDNEAASLRHVRLESFISKHTPPLVDRTGKPLGLAAQVIAKDGQLQILADFLRDHLLFHPDTLTELGKAEKAKYVPLIHGLRTNLGEAIKKDGVVDQLEIFGIQTALDLTLGIKLSKEEAERFRETADKVHKMTDFSEESIAFVNETEKAALNVHLVATDKVKELFAATEGAINELSRHKAEIDKKRKEVDDAVSRFEKESDTVVEKFKKQICDACDVLPGVVCKAACRIEEGTRTVKNDAKERFRQARDQARAALIELENGTPGRVKAIHSAFIAAMDGLTDAMKTKIALNELAQQFFAKWERGGSPLRKFLENWKDDINEAMSAFVRANGQAMVNTMIEGEIDPLKPYRTWFDCYAKGILGVPVLATKAVCTVEAGIADIKARIEEIEGHIASLTPITSAIRDLKEQLKSRVDEIKTETISEGTDVIGTELDKLRPGKISFLAWKDAFTKPTDAATLNAEFSTDKGGTGLLAIPDIAARVTQEFHGGLAEPSSRRVARRDAGDDSFDGTQFAVARNAVTLAKIAMLDQKGLRQLATEAKLSYTIYGENLYDGKSEDAGNVLYGFAKNIDGNHQWHRLAPPHPRVTGFDAGEFEARRTDPTKSFTYVDADTCEPTKGMRMWLDPLARSLLFGRIFVGPMPAAIDLPQAMDPPLSAVLPVTYPNGVSTSLPWGIDGSELPAGRSSRNAILVGRGRPGSQIELFRGSDGIGKGTVDDTGRWRMEVPMALSRSELLTMKYADRRGRILGDVTTSYCQPAVPEGAPVRTYITVVKSDNLWRIAQLVSGNGRNYVSLFEKNKHLVRDEDLIYPNQLLALPDESEWKYDPIR